MKLSLAQKQALDPHSSCWVEASAGTGKTTVLINRVLSLLLSGSQAADILCLTFTKAAGAEMENRLRDKLQRWASLDEERLKEELKGFLGPSFSDKILKKSKTLFRDVLSSSHGIRIQTIHGFCQSLLRMFPLEVGLFPHFRVMSDIEKKQLMEESHIKLWHELQEKEINFISTHFSEEQLYNFLNFCLGHKESLRQTTGKELAKNLRTLLAFYEESVNAESFSRSQVDLREKIMACGESNSKICQDLMNLGSVQVEERGCLLNNYKSLFLTAEGTIRKKLFSKDFEKKFPDVATVLFDEANRVFLFHQSILKKRVLERSDLLAHIGLKFIALYEGLKSKNAWLDYEDLIIKARDLLKKSDMKPWILEKLDYKLNHILVDEAQDTSQIQWDLVLALIEEFYGEETPNQARTFFVVGDLKQSIYSFQGACPSTFQQAKRSFQNLPRHRMIDLSLSYRTTPEILEFVDTTFSRLKAGQLEASIFSHESSRQNERGIVEVWPLVCAEKKQKLKEWDIPRISYQAADSRHLLAQKIAAHLKKWFKQGEFLESKNRALEPKDIMILVRRRDSFMEELVKALKENSIPVMGVDRMILTEQLVIKDLLCLCDVLLLPEDDLSLATLLKSPFFGLTEEELFEICQRPASQSLWESLLQSSFAEVGQQILFLQNKSVHQSLYSFFSFVLGEWGGRKYLLERLGVEIEEVLEEFLSLCLLYEETEGVDLQRFVYWIRQQNIEIKRSQEQTENRVRIMTVHGAKGLQAPVVILPDTTQIPTPHHALKYHKHSNVLVWADREMRELPELEDIFNKNEELQEYHRLLYVAMTRAEDRLYIGGWGEEEKLDPNSWYAILSGTMRSLGKIETTGDGETVSRYGTLSKSQKEDEKNSPSSMPPSAPEWLTKKWERDRGKAEKFNATAPISKQQEKGDIIHKILQWTIYTDPIQRSTIVHNYLESYPISEEMKSQIKTSIEKVFSNKDFCELIQKETKTEVPFLGYWQNQKQKCVIDLMVVDSAGKTVHIIDYKTGVFLENYRQNPPSDYVRQLSLYKQFVQDSYPTYTVLTSLFWIESGCLQSL